MFLKVWSITPMQRSFDPKPNNPRKDVRLKAQAGRQRWTRHSNATRSRFPRMACQTRLHTPSPLKAMVIPARPATIDEVRLTTVCFLKSTRLTISATWINPNALMMRLSDNTLVIGSRSGML